MPSALKLDETLCAKAVLYRQIETSFLPALKSGGTREQQLAKHKEKVEAFKKERGEAGGKIGKAILALPLFALIYEALCTVFAHKRMEKQQELRKRIGKKFVAKEEKDITSKIWEAPKPAK